MKMHDQPRREEARRQLLAAVRNMRENRETILKTGVQTVGLPTRVALLEIAIERIIELMEYEYDEERTVNSNQWVIP